MIPIKMRQMPGDVCKREKIAMMERRLGARGRSFRKMIRSRERAVLRERARREIELGFEDRDIA